MKEHAGIIGLGLLIIWGGACLFWANIGGVAGFVGGAITSVIFIAVFIYTDSLEQKIKQKDRKQVNGFYED